MSDAPLPAELAVDDEPFDDDAIDEVLDFADQSEEEQAQTAAGLSTPAKRAAEFVIDNDELAEWAMRKVAAYVADENAAADRAVEWHRRIDVWFDDHVATLAGRATFLRVHLEQYALARREADPKAKTTKLPSGVVKTTAHGDTIEIVDADDVLAWADVSAPQIVTKTVKVTDLRKVAEITQVVVGAVVSTTFDCGHRVVEHVQTDAAAVDRLLARGRVTAADGEAAGCAECSDGLGPVNRLVTDRHVEPWFSPVAAVVGEGFVDVVPGTAVRPPHVTAKVVPS